MLFSLLDLIPSTDQLSDEIILDNSHEKSGDYYGKVGVICSTCGMMHINFLSQQKHPSVYGEKSLLMLHVTYLYLSLIASLKDGAQN